MILLKVYLLIGLLTYPATIDMWYRIRYNYGDFWAPDRLYWYTGFFIYIFTWIVAFPILAIKYTKEMKK